jgi:hypothetical protein
MLVESAQRFSNLSTRLDVAQFVLSQIHAAKVSCRVSRLVRMPYFALALAT